MAKKLFRRVLPLLLIVCILLSTTAFAASTYYIEVVITGPDAKGVMRSLSHKSSKYGALSTPLAAAVVEVIHDEMEAIVETYYDTALGPIVYAGLEAFSGGEDTWKAYNELHVDEVTGGFKEILRDMDSTFADLTVNQENQISYLTEIETEYVVTVTLKQYHIGGTNYNSQTKEEAPKAESSSVERLADVNPQAWYYEGVQYCVENGLMEGYSKNLFGTNDNLTRAQVAQILYNLMSKPTVEQKELLYC